MGITFFFIGWLAILVTVKALRECDNLGVLVYDDMKCKPKFQGQDKCPSSYDCPDIKISQDSCYFKGVSTKVGEFLNASKFCDLGCQCTKRNEGLEFSCAVLECAQFGPPPPEGCYYAYSLDKCCGSLYCPPKNHPVHTCTYEGVEYREFERFFPKNSCTMCLCQEGFKGKIEPPFCIQRQCDGQIKHQSSIQKSCAPVYKRQEDIRNGILCCPELYTCPDGNEIIEGEATSPLECKYGNRTLRMGQRFKKEAKEYFRTHKVSCKCQIPPLVTCVVDSI